MSSQPSTPSKKSGLLFKLAVVLAAAHLLMVFCCALHGYTPPLRRTSGQLAYIYGQWTGATSRYSFFAPGIAAPMRVDFDVTLDSGEVVHDNFDFDNEALRIRAYAMSLRFNGMADQNKYKDIMAQAWAATMFGRYPDAHALTVRMQRMSIPAMEEYRQGARPVWNPTYQADFEFHPSSPAQASNP